MVRDGDNYFCLLCGQEKPRKGVLTAAIKANAEQIAADNTTIGQKATAEKWHISKPTVYRTTIGHSKGAPGPGRPPGPEYTAPDSSVITWDILPGEILRIEINLRRWTFIPWKEFDEIGQAMNTLMRNRSRLS